MKLSLSFLSALSFSTETYDWSWFSENLKYLMMAETIFGSFAG
jgi:hypothetical protein